MSAGNEARGQALVYHQPRATVYEEESQKMSAPVRWIVVTLAVLAVATAASGQSSQPTYVVPGLTPVALVMDAEVSSATNKPGDRFPFHVAEDVKQNDVVVIPAGSAGEGEVVDAAKARSGGRQGKLVLAARFVTVEGKTVQLRSFTAGGSGKDRSNASYAVASTVSPLAMFMRGGEIVIPAGTDVAAKIAEDVELHAVSKEPQ